MFLRRREQQEKQKVAFEILKSVNNQPASLNQSERFFCCVGMFARPFILYDYSTLCSDVAYLYIYIEIRRYIPLNNSNAHKYFLDVVEHVVA